MSGIKQLFYEHNQELMEFGVPQPVNPMMGYGGIPSYQMNPMMMQKSFKFPGMTDLNKKKDDDGFWKALLAAGAVAGLGAGGVGAYHLWNKHNSFKSQLGKALGKQAKSAINNYGDDALGMIVGLTQQHIVNQQQNNQARGFLDNVANKLGFKDSKNNSSSKTNTSQQSSTNSTNK